MVRNSMRWGLFFFIGIMLLSSAAEAKFAYDDYNKYGEEETRYIFRGRGGYALTDYNADFFRDGIKTNTVSAEEQFIDSGVAVEMEMQYRVGNHFSLGASLGYLPQQESRWSSSFVSTTDVGKMDLYPLAATVQFYPAPYGKFRPYVGLGGYYALIDTDFEYIEPDTSTMGIVAELGLDWWMSESWGVNLDMKKYFMAMDVDFIRFTNTNLKAEITADPLVIGAGVSYRFGKK